jgi:hypothetical protein
MRGKGVGPAQARSPLGHCPGLNSIGDVVKHQLDEIQREVDAAMREYISAGLGDAVFYMLSAGVSGPDAQRLRRPETQHLAAARA